MGNAKVVIRLCDMQCNCEDLNQVSVTAHGIGANVFCILEFYRDFGWHICRNIFLRETFLLVYEEPAPISCRYI